MYLHAPSYTYLSAGISNALKCMQKSYVCVHRKCCEQEKRQQRNLNTCHGKYFDVVAAAAAGQQARSNILRKWQANVSVSVCVCVCCCALCCICNANAFVLFVDVATTTETMRLMLLHVAVALVAAAAAGASAAVAIAAEPFISLLWLPHCAFAFAFCCLYF